MKPIAIVAFFIIFISCNKSDPGPTGDLLINGNMEQGTSAPNDWASYVGLAGNYSLTWTTDQASSPSHSLKISCTTSDASNTGYWSQIYNDAIPTGKDLIFKVKIKTNLTGGGASIALRADDSTLPSGMAEQYVTTENSLTISGSADWTTYQVKLPNIHSNIKCISVYMVCLQNTTGEVYFDDAQLSQ